MSRLFFFFFSSRRRHTRFDCDWSSDVCSSDLPSNGIRRAHIPHSVKMSLRGHDRNCAHSRGHHWPSAACAGGRSQLAHYFSSAAPSQLPPVFLWPTRLTYRHLAATNRHELVRL